MDAGNAGNLSILNHIFYKFIISNIIDFYESLCDLICKFQPQKTKTKLNCDLICKFQPKKTKTKLNCVSICYILVLVSYKFQFRVLLWNNSKLILLSIRNLVCKNGILFSSINFRIQQLCHPRIPIIICWNFRVASYSGFII